MTLCMNRLAHWALSPVPYAVMVPAVSARAVGHSVSTLPALPITHPPPTHHGWSIISTLPAVSFGQKLNWYCLASGANLTLQLNKNINTVFRKTYFDRGLCFSLASIGRACLTASTWSASLFSVSTRKCFVCMRLISTAREVRRRRIIMKDDLLSPVQCEDPPGIYRQLEAFITLLILWCVP